MDWSSSPTTKGIPSLPASILRPQHLDDEGDPNRRQFISLYQGYQEICDRGGLVDFAELLLCAHELWRDNPELLLHYQSRFQHLLVDEFQDTNAIQYAWLRMLAGKDGIPFVVGDDDQSIYRWRGARVEHIYQFQKDFPSATVIKLEQNYRSTATILNAANALIANNESRMGKKLWTEGAEGEPIKIYSAYNERDEADFVVARLRDWSDQGNPRADAAVLYRSPSAPSVSSISPNSCYARTNYGGIILNCSRIIKVGFSICWLTNFRTPTLFSTPGSGCSPAKMVFHLSSVTMTNLSIAGAAPVSSTSINFRRTSRAHRSSSSNRITGRQQRY